MAQKKSKKNKSKRPFWLRIILWGFSFLFLLGILGAAGIAYILWYSRDLPEILEPQDYRPEQMSRMYAADGELIAEFSDHFHRTVIPFEEIPQVMRDAMIAAEDANFYEHGGIDYRGLTIAMLRNLKRRRISFGASTLTQQVVKNVILTPERSLQRKIQEALLALRVEKNLTKDEIITIYLNEVFWGVHYYGVEEASRYYFGHSASELSLPEAAMLAGMIQSPNRNNPFRHPDQALRRQRYVLRQMFEKGFIEEGAYRAAEEVGIVLAEENENSSLNEFPYYTDAVRRALLEEFTEEELLTGGLQIHTALDPHSQRIAQDAIGSGLREFDANHGFHTPYQTLEGEEAIQSWLEQNAETVESIGLEPDQSYHAVVLSSDEEATLLGIGPFEVSLRRSPESRLLPEGQTWGSAFVRGQIFTVFPSNRYSVETLQANEAQVRLRTPPEASAVVIDPITRQVQALVGGYDFENSSFNRAIQARRQVGSAFKPLIYGALIDARIAMPATIYLDQPITFPLEGQSDWQPQNYDHRFDGPMSLRTALARSRNVIAVRALDQVGIDAAQNFAQNAGITSAMPDNLTLALGSAEVPPLELTNAFTTIANHGTWAEPILITRVEDCYGNRLYSPPNTQEQRLDPAVTWLVESMMRSVVTSGTARRAQSVGHPVAGKTGTTNGSRDAWFIGFSPQLVASVWVGRDDNTPLGRRTSGGATALPIWIDLMTRLHEDRPVLEFADPPIGVISTRIDPVSGELAREETPNARTDYFLQGSVPTTYAPLPSENTIDNILLGNPTENTENPDSVLDDF